jgi:hypothetical protein
MHSILPGAQHESREIQQNILLLQVRNARLGMLAVGGFAVQAWVTGKGPIQNAIDHLKDPFGQNSELASVMPFVSTQMCDSCHQMLAASTIHTFVLYN